MAEQDRVSRNPIDLLVCDTDALIQIFTTDQVGLLKHLKRIYGIQCVITEAVLDELENPRQRHAIQIQAPLERALSNDSLIVLDRRSIGRFTSNDPHTTYDTIQLKGQEFNRIVQRGEAYTHATALILRAGVLSNDHKALLALDRSKRTMAAPILRAYDLFALFNQRGDLPARDCDDIRKALTQIEDSPHVAFAGCKFAEGISRFYPRLVDPTFIVIGSLTTRELGDERRIEIISLELLRANNTTQP